MDPARMDSARMRPRHHPIKFHVVTTSQSPWADGMMLVQCIGVCPSRYPAPPPSPALPCLRGLPAAPLQAVTAAQNNTGAYVQWLYRMYSHMQLQSMMSLGYIALYPKDNTATFTVPPLYSSSVVPISDSEDIGVSSRRASVRPKELCCWAGSPSLPFPPHHSHPPNYLHAPVRGRPTAS